MPYKTACFYCLSAIQAQSDEAFGYGLHKECYLKWFSLKELEEFSSIARRSNSNKKTGAALPKESWGASFFIGKFKKYSAMLASESYILKVKDDEAPELPELEYLCNQIAKETDIPNPDFYFLHFSNVGTFVTKNFVRKGANVDLTHIHHYLPGGASEYNCESIIKVILEHTKRLTNAETFIKTCLFDVLVGNGDRHSRNLGFLVTPRGIELSPIYDNASNLGLEQGEILKSDWNPTGKIATKDSTEPGCIEYVEDFFRLGYGDVVAKWFASVSLPKIKGLITKSFCGELMKQAMDRLVSKRYQEMASAIKKRSQ
jgi:hypothetical protein